MRSALSFQTVSHPSEFFPTKTKPEKVNEAKFYAIKLKREKSNEKVMTERSRTQST
jgi:hypothetical protein